MSNFEKEHWKARLKHMLKYIVGSLNIDLCFIKRYDTLFLKGYVNSNFTGDRDSRKSTIALYFTLGGNCIS